MTATQTLCFGFSALLVLVGVAALFFQASSLIQHFRERRRVQRIMGKGNNETVGA